MLLNLSNHPSENWPKNQLEIAINFYGSVIDLAFPQINPHLDSDGLDSLVDQFEQQVQQINPSVVHIMGEMTFTFRLVHRLKALGITCIASTTERITEIEDNTKTSIFKFVQFRNY